MRRHPFDPASLLAGLVFLALSGAYLAAGFADVDLPLEWVVPALLIGLGLTGLVRIVTRGRHREM